MEPKEANITVEVKGNKFDFTDFSSESIIAQVDLAGYTEGKIKVPIDVRLREFSNLKIGKIEPSEILFTLEKIITNDLPVTINTDGKLASNYVLGDLSTTSPMIQVKGPRSIVNEVAKIVATVNIDGRMEDDSVNVPVKAIDDEGNDVVGVTIEPKVIDVNIPVFRTVNVPIELQTEIPENYEITKVSIKPNRITLKGDRSIASITSIQTKPVDIEILMNEENVPVELELPENVSLLNQNEKIYVSLEIREAFTKTFEYTLDEIEFVDLDEELIIDEEVLSNTVEIQVKGSNEVIEALTKEDLEVYLNLSNYEEGTHLIYVNVNLPEDLAINYITPQLIEVTLISR